jgi:arylsulfatase A-like enzyme
MGQHTHGAEHHQRRRDTVFGQMVWFRNQSMIRSGSLFALIGLTIAFGCDGQGPSPGEAGVSRPDIVLIVLDTVRRDRLSAYGYERNTSPEFDALASKSRRYTDAHATGAWTVPSHASVFTGLYAASHGATQETTLLAQGLETLAETLSGAGYETAAITGNAMINRERGFDQGFEHYRESWRKVKKVNRDPVTVEWVKAFLGERKRNRPYFLFVNLIGAHTPFDSCGLRCGKFGESLGGGIVDSDWLSVYRGRRNLSAEQLERLQRLYDAEIAEVDRNLGQILRALEDYYADKLAGDPLLIVTSDHGENIGDHGHVNHVFSLHETTVAIPLVIRPPGRATEGGALDDRPVQLVDLYPTILKAAGFDLEAYPSQGFDLFDSRLDSMIEGRPVFAEYYRPRQALEVLLRNATPLEAERLAKYRRRLKSVTEDGWKLVWAGDGSHELYDLGNDPGELRNLIRDPAAASRRDSLLATLNELMSRYEQMTQDPKARAPSLDAETREELRALGYLE